MLLLIKHNNAGIKIKKIKKAKRREWERDTERYQKRQRLIKNLMSCWWVSALRDTQSDASNHCTRPSGGGGPGGDLQRTPCLLPSTTYASLPHYVMWNGIKAGLYYPQTVITPEFPPWHPSPHTLYSLILLHKGRDIVTVKGNEDIPLLTQRACCIHKHRFKRSKEWGTETMYVFIFPCRCSECVKTFGIDLSDVCAAVCLTWECWQLKFHNQSWDIFGEAYCFF